MRTKHYVVLVCAFASLPGCTAISTSRTISEEDFRSISAKLAFIYECVFYHYLDNNEQRGEELIDKATAEGQNAGLDATQILSIYSKARSEQRQKTIESASAKKRAELKIQRIMQDQVVVPSQEEVERELLALYKSQCSDQDPQWY
jgi:hypothetical protein